MIMITVIGLRIAKAVGFIWLVRSGGRFQYWQCQNESHLLGPGVMPAAIGCDYGIGLFRSPGAALVGAGPVVGPEDWLDHRPGGLNCVLTGEQRAVADHGVAQEPLVGRFFSRLFFEHVKFFLVADELLPGRLTRAASATAELGESRNRR